MANSDLKELIERVKNATGPDREIDYELAMLGRAGAMLRDNGYKRLSGDYGWYSSTPVIQGAEKIAPPMAYTGELDAIVYLTGEILPGAKVGFDPIFFDEGQSVQWDAIVCIPHWDRWVPVNSDWIERREARHPDQCLAACAALLAALAATEAKP